MTRWIQKYFDRVIMALPHDDHIAETFMQVMNLNKPATALFHPAIAWKALTYRASSKSENVIQPQTAPSH